jgi:XTP/dITP diphosphohydrolase
MNEIPRLLLGTGNPGKAREMRALLADAGAELLLPADVGLSLHVEETGHSYAANASHKATVYARTAGFWAIADDTGLEVAALDGSPGLYSARLAGAGASDADRRRKLLALLAAIDRPWLARFVCTMALASPERLMATTMGECRGEIVPEARGEGGFGYDPIFLVYGEGKTMAELGADRKNRISHRAQAAQAMLPRLRDALGVG